MPHRLEFVRGEALGKERIVTDVFLQARHERTHIDGLTALVVDPHNAVPRPEPLLHILQGHLLPECGIGLSEQVIGHGGRFQGIGIRSRRAVSRIL